MDKLLSLLEKVLGPSRKTTYDNYAFYSPFLPHRKRKLQIRLDTQEDDSGRPLNHWHCWITEKKGRSIYSLFNQPEIKSRINQDIINELNNIFDDQKFNVFLRHSNDYHQEKIKLPDEYKFLFSVDTFESRFAYRYLKNIRKVSDEAIIKYRVGFCDTGKYKNRIIIPSYDEFGIVNYFNARDYKGSEYLKYLNPPTSANCVGFENQINWKYPVILTEGMFDAITIKRNVIPLFGKSLSDELKYKLFINDVEEVIICLDSDAKNEIINMSKYFLSNGIKTRIVKLKDNDPNELGYDRIWEYINQSKYIKFTDIIKFKLGL